MKSTDQDQRVGSGGQAIQAGRDVVIQKGLSADDMTKILVAMSKELAIYQADALRAVDERLKEFQEDVLGAFTRRIRAAIEKPFVTPTFNIYWLMLKKLTPAPETLRSEAHW